MNYGERKVTLLALRAFRFYCYRKAARHWACGRVWAAVKWNGRRMWATSATAIVKAMPEHG